MVRHHGGVPYLKIPQDKDTDDLNVPRNSTAECFDFIIKDLDDAIALLPERILSLLSGLWKDRRCLCAGL